jgi:cysteinyl-tRNA synthetase
MWASCCCWWRDCCWCVQVQEQIAARAAARAAKDFAAADGVRKQLEAVGVWLMDTPGGTTWRPGLPSGQEEAA